MDVFRFGLHYWKKYIPLSLLSKLFSLLAMVCDLAIPLISAGIIDYLIDYDPLDPPEGGGILGFLFTGWLGEPQTWQLFAGLAIVFACVLGARLIFLYCKNVTFQWCGLRMECTLREETYAKLLELDGETISRYNMGELLTTMNRDTITFKELYSRILMNLFDSSVMIVLSIVILTTLDPFFLILPVVITPVILFFLIRYLTQARKLFRAIRDGYSQINLDVQENVDAVRIVRSYAAEEEEIRKFDACNDKVRELNCREVRLTAKYNSIFLTFQQIGYVGTVIIAVLLVLSGNFLLGTLTAATTYVTKIISHITQISRSCFMMQNQLVSGARLKKFLTEQSAVPDCPSAQLCSVRPHIAFHDVSLTLGEKQVLKHVDLDVPYGKKVGLMGGTGSGKSALLKLLARVFDVTVENDKHEKQYVWQNSWGFTTRSLGVCIMVHGDDRGLVLPPRVAPIQAVVLPIAAHKPGVAEKAQEVADTLKAAGLRVFLDDRDTYSAGWKFNEWEMKGVPARVEVGPRDIENGVVTVCRRDTLEKVQLPIDSVGERVAALMDEIHDGLFQKALAFRDSHIQDVTNMEELGEAVQHGFARAMWCGDDACELEVKNRFNAKTRNMPFDQTPIGDTCVVCGKKATKLIYFGKQY